MASSIDVRREFSADELIPLFELFSEGVVARDAEGRVVGANAAACAMLGRNLEELKELSYSPDQYGALDGEGRHLDPADYAVSKALRTGKPVTDERIGVRNPADGKLHWLSVNALPLFRQGEDRPYLALSSFSDRTKERELADLAEDFSSLYKNLNEGCALHELVFDGDGRAVNYRVLDVNPQYTVILGIARETAAGKLATELYGTPEPPYLEEFARPCEMGQGATFSTYFEPMDKHFHISVAPLSRSRFATVFFDLSDRVRAEERVAQVLEELEQKNKDLENIVYAASHDLRSPLVNIQGFSQKVKVTVDEFLARAEADGVAGAGELRVKADSSFKYIRSGAAKMDKVINGLLAFSRTGRVAIVPRRLDMDALAADIAQRVEFQLQEAGGRVELGSMPPCHADREQVDRILSNLVDNAIKYRSPARPLLIRISGETRGAEAVYTVEDNGRGIKPEHLDRVWELFNRLDPRQGPEGEGIGLAIVRRLARKLGGRCWCESRFGEGSAFHMGLPLGERAAREEGGGVL